MGNDTEIVHRLRAIMDVAHISYTELGAGAGVAPSTVRHALATGNLPDRSVPRTRLVQFADTNRGARRRADLRFV